LKISKTPILSQYFSDECLSTHFHGSRVDTRATVEAVAIFGCALSQSRHTEFWGFSTAKPELYPQICKKIKSKFE